MVHELSAKRALNQVPLRISSSPHPVYCRVLWSIDNQVDASQGAVVDENGNDLGGVVAIDGIRGLQNCQPSVFGDAFYECIATNQGRRGTKPILRPIRFAGVGPAGASIVASLIVTSAQSVKLHDFNGTLLTTTISGAALQNHLPFYSSGAISGYQHSVASMRFATDQSSLPAGIILTPLNDGWQYGIQASGNPLTFSPAYANYNQNLELDFWYSGASAFNSAWVSGRFRVLFRQTSAGSYTIQGAVVSGGERAGTTDVQSTVAAIVSSGSSFTISLTKDANPLTTQSAVLSITTDSTTGRTTSVTVTLSGFANGQYAGILVGGTQTFLA